MTKFIKIQELAQKLNVSRGKIYAKIVYGHLKEGTDWKEINTEKKVIVVREDLKV